MEKSFISEEKVKEILSKILSEEKVGRDQYIKMRFKLDDLSQSMNECLKELRQAQDSVPNKFKGTIGSKLNTIGASIESAQKSISQIKEKIKQLKKAEYRQQVEEKKK